MIWLKQTRHQATTWITSWSGKPYSALHLVSGWQIQSFLNLSNYHIFTHQLCNLSPQNAVTRPGPCIPNNHEKGLLYSIAYDCDTQFPMTVMTMMLFEILPSALSLLCHLCSLLQQNLPKFASSSSPWTQIVQCNYVSWASFSMDTSNWHKHSATHNHGSPSQTWIIVP